MKSHLILFYLILVATRIYSQQSNLTVPVYFGANVNGLKSFTTSGSFSSTSHGFDQVTYPNFQHTCQNAWFENGKVIFYVISGVDLSTSTKHTLVYNSNGKVVSDIDDLAINEIGLFKISCSFYHVIVGNHIYALILEPFNSSSAGTMVLAATIPDALHVIGNGTFGNCFGIEYGGTSFAISKPSFSGIDPLMHYYTLYYIADLDAAHSKKPWLNKINIFYNDNSFGGLGNMKTVNTRISTPQNLYKLDFPFFYSNISELELSPDQLRVALIDKNRVLILDFSTGIVVPFSYDLKDPSNYPNFGKEYQQCSELYNGQPCGIEFSHGSNLLYISFYTAISPPWPSGTKAILCYDWINNNSTLINNSENYSNSYIELGSDNNLFVIGKDLNNSRVGKIDPSTNVISDYSIGKNNLNFRSLNCQIGCNGGNAYAPYSQFYTLPDQIDGMDYSFFSTDNCCNLTNELLLQLDDFYRVNSDETWENDDIIYKEVRVKSGATLTIKNCTINFKENASIIVETGGKLYVDNAKLTNECNALWPGIVVEGSPNAHNINSQGFVWLKNNAIIEHAVQAVMVNSRAIAYATSGSKVLNCLNGIKFLTSSTIADNLSYVQDVIFECNTLIPTQSTGTLKFLEFNGINWAGVYGCSFKNTLPYSSLNANNRGIGIEVQNSNITLHKSHNVFDPVANCFTQTGAYNTFSQLTHGILTALSEHLVVDYANFYNCQSSIEISNSGESHITNSIFTLDQNYVYQPRGFQDFILLSSVNGYHISQNVFDWHEPLSVFNGINGIRIEGTSTQKPSNGGEFRNNIFSYDNSFNPAIIPDVTGIYLNTTLKEIKVEWNTFNDLMIDWLLTSICQVQAQTLGGECKDPYNKWSQATYTYKHILNNGIGFDYCSKFGLLGTAFDPMPKSTGIADLYLAVGIVNQNTITCPYPHFDAAWGINLPYRIPKDVANISINPNPLEYSNNYLSYHVKDISTIDELSIYNLEGKQILSKKNQPAQGKINIAECNLSKGIYYLQIVTDRKAEVRKFILK